MGVLDRFRLDGKRLFVTGGSRGLGREMALAIADEGADVVLIGRDAGSLEKTAGDKLLRDLVEGEDDALQALALAADVLGLLVIVPEAGILAELYDFLETRFLGVVVKDTPSGSGCGWQGPRASLRAG